MAQQKVEVVKVRSLTEFFSVKQSNNKIVLYTPKDFTWALIKPRLVRGQYGTTAQIAQYKQNGWSQVSVRLENLDALAKAISGLMNMVGSAIELGYLGEKEVPIETLQAVAAYLEDAAGVIRRAIEALKKKSK